MTIIVIKNPSAGLEIAVNGLVLWYGVASTIPAGWAIYSTANGNLVMGASAGVKVLTPAGSNTHVHTNTSPSGSGGSHDHTASNPSVGSGSAQDAFGSGTNVASSGHTHSTNNTVSASGSAHTHTIGSANAGDSLPPYHRLYWIERTA